MSVDRLAALNEIAKNVDEEKELTGYDEADVERKYESLERQLSGETDVEEDGMGEEIPDKDIEAAAVEDEETAPTNAEPEPDEYESTEADSPVYERDGVYYTKQKVYGQEVERPLEDVLADAQKVAAADQKFQQAAELQRQAEQYAASLQEQNSQPTLPAQDDEEAKARHMEFAKQHRELLLDGEDEKADKLHADYLSTLGQGQTMDESQVQQVVQNYVTTAQQQQVEKDAFNSFSEAYPDIVNDPHLFAMADSISKELYSADPGMSIQERFELTGKEVYKRLGRNTGETRKTRKRAAPSVRGRSTKQQPAQQQAPQTNADIIANMKAARGQSAGGR